MKSKTVIDLFCGCGGMSAGLEKCGLDIRLGTDINSKYLQTFARNFGADKALEADISKTTGKELLDAAKLKFGELDFLVGGPPCQGFSKNTPVKNRTLDSDNNILMREFLRLVEETGPRNVIIENVAEMKNGFGGKYTELIHNRLHNLGYSIIHHVFDASDYGVPQRRKRAFFLASKETENLVIAPPTHSDKEKETSTLFPLKEKVSVWDAIGDLPSIAHDETTDFNVYPSQTFSDYQMEMRGNCDRILNHTPRKLSSIQFERLNSLEPGQGLKDLPKHLQVKGGYSGVYGRLTEEMVSPTITRWVFHPGSGRWGHPRDIRTITPREIARIQGFWDEYEFVGSYTDICGQLGNAVPALLMKTIYACFNFNRSWK